MQPANICRNPYNVTKVITLALRPATASKVIKKIVRKKVSRLVTTEKGIVVLSYDI
jgi:hypothetical protein